VIDRPACGDIDEPSFDLLADIDLIHDVLASAIIGKPGGDFQQRFADSLHFWILSVILAMIAEKLAGSASFCTEISYF
jgi:hypothetical protein